jgi:hypothetical protein
MAIAKVVDNSYHACFATDSIKKQATTIYS